MSKIKPSIPHENLLTEIELVFPIWHREIERLRAKDECTSEELYLSVKLVTAMRESYIAFRVFRSELKQEVKYAPSDKLIEMINAYRSQN